MWIISKSRLRAFWESPGREASEGPLRAWYAHVGSKTIDWTSWADVRTSFGSARLVGDCVVFNIGGNKYRLVARILYLNHKVFVLKVMTHREYDEDRWKEECGCYAPAESTRAGKSSRAR